MGVLDFINTGLQAGAQVLNQINQHKQWEREDTAVQRRVKDLQAAGLSPVLAAGSAALSSAPIRVEAPQFKRDVEAQSAGIAQTKVQRELTLENLLLAKTNEMNAWAYGAEARNKQALLHREPKIAEELAKSQVQRAIDENKEVSRNLGIYREYGVPTLGAASDDIIARTKLLSNIIPGMDSPKAGGWSVVLRTLLSLAGKR